MESFHYMDVLRGRCQELPDVRSKVVRVFLSSTFSDTLSERDSLIETVFPKLKDYCREKYGLEFQYADMRWGIPTESADNHGEVETCLREIELCKKYSIATNFVVLLSHRYGSRPTPATIRASLFEQLHDVVRSNPDYKDDAELLSQWYQLDTNCIPAAYILRPISSMLPNMSSSDTEEVKRADKEWKEINHRIRTSLRQAAATCLKQGQIEESEYDDFFISVTEKEIINGILSASDANQRTLCFLRKIEDIHEHILDNKASKYIDLCYSKDGKPIIDHEAENLLNRLKYTRIPNVLQSKNIFTYKVRWSSNGINRRDHAEHISRFNDEFYNAIQQQIDQCVVSRVMRVSDPLQHEILEHAIQCKTYVAKFHGRTDVLHKLEEYVKNDQENRPCIVYGASGCGKTSLLAKAAIEVSSNWWSNRSVSVILRFLGTTPSSSTVYKTLLSISRHICKIYNLTMQVHPDVLQLRYQLETNLFTQIPKNEYLIILLDSIDQLEVDAYDCQWLPTTFPHNVKCIVSTLPDHGGILSNLKMTINYNPLFTEYTQHLLVFVSPFDASTVEIVYNNWLKIKQRSLSDEQRLFIRDFMGKRTEILPLFMKLFFDIIAIWHSYDIIDDNLKKLNSVDDCIRYLFNHLKTIHNDILFSRALCYMTACRNGISQNELEDVLSLDDDVLKSVFQHYIPPVRRLPGILWTRIRNDLDEYITEKEIDDSSVIYWYHRRFIEVAQSVFISKLKSDEQTEIFQNMVDLYKETWKGKNKPFKIDNANLINKYNLLESHGEIQANRLTTSQPIEFVDVNGRIQFNKRKLNELPQFLSRLTSELAIPIAAKDMFFNYSFMRAKIACSPFDDIMQDLQKFKQMSAYRLSKEVMEIKLEIDILFMLYLIAGALLQEYPENYSFEVSSRLLSLFGIKPQITCLIQQFDEQSIHHCSLIVPYCQLQPPGSGLLYSLNKHTAPVIDLDFTEDQMVAISLSDRIVVIDMAEAKAVLDINLPKLDESYLNSTTLTKIAYFDGNKEVENSSDSNDKNDQFKKFLFLVNSFHHIYLVSAYEDIKFEKSSAFGYSTVEILNMKRGLCVITEINGNCVECLDVVRNRLFSRIEFPSSTVKKVICVKIYSMIVTILHDGTIHFHSVIDWTKSEFIHRGSIEAGIHLDLVTLDDQVLICTFDATIPTDFAFINLKSFSNNEQVLTNKEILKILVAFDPPLESKPIKRIILPNKEAIDAKTSESNFPMFMAITNGWLYIVHKCTNKNISYVGIKGHFDIVSVHAKYPNTVYTARGGIIELYKWTCSTSEDGSDNNHKYQLYVSIDISSSPVTTIKSSAHSASMFLCSMQNGVIQAYSAKQAREAYKKMPAFPRTNELIQSIQLLGATAVTLDVSKRELTSWSYQHFTSIESTRLFTDNITINDYAIMSSNLNSGTIFVLVLTSNHWIEIYSAKSLVKKPVFSLHLDSAAKVHSTNNGHFLILTKDGVVRSIAQQEEFKFSETANAQINFRCSMMFSSILTINSSENLIVFADNGQLMAVWAEERIIYIDINFSPDLLPLSSHLKSVIGERTQDMLLLHFDNKTLLLCQVKVDESNDRGSLFMTSFEKADKFCLKNNYLAKFNNAETQLSWYNIRSSLYHQPIQIQNECQHLCLNESGTYVFALVKPRVLLMYRVSDQRQLAKLFIYDFVTFMIADNDFLVLAMNDRRLLTLMIADPDDSTLQAKIQALPSRNSRHVNKSATKNLVQQLEKYANMSSSSEESDFAEDDGDDDRVHRSENDHTSTISKHARPSTLFRFVTRLTGRHSLSKMNFNDELRSRTMAIFSNDSHGVDVAQVTDDSDNEDSNADNDLESLATAANAMPEQDIPNDLNDIRQRTLEYEQQQFKGIQFANAGHGNLKVVNSYSVTSNTCSLF